MNQTANYFNNCVSSVLFVSYNIDNVCTISIYHRCIIYETAGVGVQTGRSLVWCRYVVNSTQDLGVFLRIWNWYILSIELNLKFKIIPSVSFNVEAVEIKHFYKYFNGYNKSK